jgi:hypothetical protein
MPTVTTALRGLLPWRRTGRVAAHAAPPVTYDSDGLRTWHVADFLNDPRFQRAYRLGKATGSWGAADIEWRAYVACWAAAKGVPLEGDFIECGVYRGGLARAVMEYIDFAHLPQKRFYLLDTFCGFPPDHRPLAAAVHRDHYTDDCFADVSRTFAPFPNAVLVRGAVPATLAQVDAKMVCYLSIDMNCAEPEIAAAEHFWDRMSSGAVMVLDDYAYSEAYHRQKVAFDTFARARGVPVLCLPTGQGLVFKP